jgi:hypothetical protein
MSDSPIFDHAIGAERCRQKFICPLLPRRVLRLWFSLPSDVFSFGLALKNGFNELSASLTYEANVDKTVGLCLKRI